MQKIFVTSELSPFTGGGIGRIVHNLLVEMNDRERSSTIVVGVDLVVDAKEFQSRFPGVEFATISTAEDVITPSQMPPFGAYQGNPWLWRSRCILAHLQSRPHIDAIRYIEFADWGAPAFATIQEKITGGLFQKATIAVRLHTAHAVLCAEEGYNFGQADRVLADMERKCCRDCDMPISQNLSAADRMRVIYGFSPEEWNSKLVQHVPPVVLDSPLGREKSVIPHNRTPILFTSKLQKIKDPKTFLRSAAAFAQQTPGFKGDVIFAANSLDGEYAESVFSLVSEKFRARVRKLSDGKEARDTLISKGIVVFPGRFESFCLAAYEASMAGAVVILNRRNPIR